MHASKMLTHLKICPYLPPCFQASNQGPAPIHINRIEGAGPTFLDRKVRIHQTAAGPDHMHQQELEEHTQN